MSNENVSYDTDCVKAGILMLWRPTKKAWRKKHVQIFRRSDAGFERLDYKCLKKNDLYKSISLNGLISARMMVDKTYKSVISLTLSDERALLLAVKDTKEPNPDIELGEWLQLIKDICWPNKTILQSGLSQSNSENFYEQPESVEYESSLSSSASQLSHCSSIDVYQSVDDNQEENELYSASSELPCLGCVFKVTVRETDAAKSCNLSGNYALEVKHDGLTLRNYETRAAIFEWKLEFIRRFGATAKTKVFHFEAGRRCVGYAGAFEFYSEQFNQIPKVIRDCVNKHKLNGDKSEHSNSAGSSSPCPSGDDNVYSAVDELKKEQISQAVLRDRPNILEKRNSGEAPTLPHRTGEEDLYQDPNTPDGTYGGCDSTLILNHRSQCNTEGTYATPPSHSGGGDIYESLQNAVSGAPQIKSVNQDVDSSPSTPVNSFSHSPRNTPSSDEEGGSSIYSNIDISADHESGTIRGSKSMERKPSGMSVAMFDESYSHSKSMEHLYDVTPAQLEENEEPPEPPTRRSSYHVNKALAVQTGSPTGLGAVPFSQMSTDFPRGPFPCNIPRPPGLLQMLNVPRQHAVKSNLQTRPFSSDRDSYL